MLILMFLTLLLLSKDAHCEEVLRWGLDPESSTIFVQNRGKRPIYICSQAQKHVLSDDNVDTLCGKAKTYDTYRVIPIILSVYDIIIWEKSIED